MNGKVSVIICTAHRLKTVAECLDSLTHQSVKNFEVILVDGRLDQQLQPVLVKYQNKLRLKHLKITKQNLPYARNHGILYAQHPLIAFIDDDAIATKNWVKNLLSFHRQNKNCLVFGGKVLALEKNYVARFLETFFNFGNRSKEVPTILGVNMILNRTAIDRLWQSSRKKYFLDSLTTAGDETEFCFAIRKSGGAIMYDPRTVVKHRYRSSLSQFIWRTIEYAKGDFQVMTLAKYRRFSLITKQVALANRSLSINKLMGIILFIKAKVLSFSRDHGLIWLPLILLRELSYFAGIELALRKQIQHKHIK